MTDWKDDKNLGPWAFTKQYNKWAYLNNPRWQVNARKFVHGGPDDYNGRESEEPQIWEPTNRLNPYSRADEKTHHQCGHWHTPTVSPTTAPPAEMNPEVYFELLPATAAQPFFQTPHADLLCAESFIPINANRFNGSPEWFFEAAGMSTYAFDLILQAVDSDGNVCSTITIPAGTVGASGFEMFRFRESFTPTITDDIKTYGLKLIIPAGQNVEGFNPPAARATISYARIIVRQTNPTKTTVQVPLYGGYMSMALQEYKDITGGFFGPESYPYDFPTGITLSNAHNNADSSTSLFYGRGYEGVSIWKYDQTELATISRFEFSVAARSVRKQPPGTKTQSISASLSFQHFHYMLYRTTGADTARANANPQDWVNDTQVHTDNISGRVYTPIPGSLVDWTLAGDGIPFDYTIYPDFTGVSGNVYLAIGGELYYNLPPENKWEHWSTMSVINIPAGGQITDAELHIFSTADNQMTWTLTYRITPAGDTNLTVSLYDETAGAIVPGSSLVWALADNFSEGFSRKSAILDIANLVDGHEYRAGIQIANLTGFYDAQLMDAQLLISLDPISRLTTWRRCLMQNNNDWDGWSYDWAVAPTQINIAPQVLLYNPDDNKLFFEVTHGLRFDAHTSSIEQLVGDGTGIGTTEIVPSRLTLPMQNTPARVRSAEITLTKDLVYSNRQSAAYTEGDGTYSTNGFIVTKYND